MSARRPSQLFGETFLPALVTNLVPLAGVLALGWDAAALVVVYTVEVLLSLALAGFEALFAQRHPPAEREGVVSVGDAELTDKRGSVRVVDWLPPVYPRNVPFVAGVVTGVCWFSVFIGVIVVSTVDVGALLGRTSVLLSLAGLVVTSVGGSAWRYFARREYADISPYGVIEPPARRVFFLAFLLVAVAEAGGVVVLAAIVLVKTLVEYSLHRAERGETGRLTGWLSGPDEADNEPDPVTVPDGEPSAAFVTDRRTVLVAATVRALRRAASVYFVLFFFAWLVGVAIAGGDDLPLAWLAALTAAVLALYVGALAVRVGSSYLRLAPLEFRRYGDRVVAYDTWLAEPQWSVSTAELRDVYVVSDRLADRLTGTRTLRFTAGWSDDGTEQQVGPLADYEAAIAAFDVPVADTEFGALDRRAGAIAVCLLVGYVLAAAYALTGPFPEANALFAVVFGLPFAVMFATGMWRWSYPDRRDRGENSWRE